MYYQTIQQFIKMLNNLNNFLDKAVVYSEEKKCDINNILTARLAVDQFNLIKQIQVISDNAKNTTARFVGQEAPKFEDNEKNIQELKERITKTSEYLKQFKEEDFSNSSNQKITLPFMPGKYIDGEDYLIEFAIPNFYFHFTTAYSILRNCGVNVGKFDYIGSVNFKPLEE
ncbi:MAG: DUF1993 domain-containing protein [Candidatus Sericytochromatia bacterium]|nr:DUF1993 domain-containing protein [Candidatus Sericytochromatia bacterium]